MSMTQDMAHFGGVVSTSLKELEGLRSRLEARVAEIRADPMIPDAGKQELEQRERATATQKFHGITAAARKAVGDGRSFAQSIRSRAVDPGEVERVRGLLKELGPDEIARRFAELRNVEGLRALRSEAAYRFVRSGTSVQWAEHEQSVAKIEGYLAELATGDEGGFIRQAQAFEQVAGTLDQAIEYAGKVVRGSATPRDTLAYAFATGQGAAEA